MRSSRRSGLSNDEVVPTEVTLGMGKLARYTCTPDVALEMDRIWNETDVRGVLPAVRVPTLLMDRDVGARAQIDYVASLMPNAQVVRIRGEDEFQPEYVDRVHDAIRTFLGLAIPVSTSGRVLSTVLFTDIVDSTKKAAELGDERWKGLLADHHSRTREELARHRRPRGRHDRRWLLGHVRRARTGRPLRAGDPGIGTRDRPRGRAGVHTGEVELVGDGVQGLAVHVGARVGALAGPSEVLVSSTVKDLDGGLRPHLRRRR